MTVYHTPRSYYSQYFLFCSSAEGNISCFIVLYLGYIFIFIFPPKLEDNFRMASDARQGIQSGIKYRQQNQLYTEWNMDSCDNIWKPDGQLPMNCVLNYVTIVLNIEFLLKTMYSFIRTFETLTRICSQVKSHDNDKNTFVVINGALTSFCLGHL